MKAITILKSVSTWVKNKSAKLKGVKIMNTLNFVTARFKKAPFFRAGVRELMASVFVAGAVVFVFVFTLVLCLYVHISTYPKRFTMPLGDAVCPDTV